MDQLSFYMLHNLQGYFQVVVCRLILADNSLIFRHDVMDKHYIRVIGVLKKNTETLTISTPLKNIYLIQLVASEARKAVGLSRSLAIRQLSVCVYECT